MRTEPWFRAGKASRRECGTRKRRGERPLRAALPGRSRYYPRSGLPSKERKDSVGKLERGTADSDGLTLPTVTLLVSTFIPSNFDRFEPFEPLPDKTG